MAKERRVLVIGAGVTGLTSALFLAEAGYKVTVLAAHVPGDLSIEYTSPWAGAHWLPHSTSNEPEQCDWDVQSYQYWLAILEREHMDPGLFRSGLKMNESYMYWDRDVTDDIWWAPHVKDFEQIPMDANILTEINGRAPPDRPQISSALVHKAMCIDVDQYLRYLQHQLSKLGGQVLKFRLPTTSGFLAAIIAAERVAREYGRGDVDVYVNCTGLGAFTLCDDKAMFPIRGQTVLVKGEPTQHHTRLSNGSVAYCIPRPGSGTTILGGTKEKGNWSKDPDPKETERILEQNAWQVPELLTGENGGFEVISVQCGLRPGREGGPRVEGEVVGGRKIVHAYGHAGAGYQNSVGSARKVVKLVQHSLTRRPRL